jgi:hypothetical protein
MATSTLTAAPTDVATPYLRGSLPVSLILGSFFALTVPLSVLAVLDGKLLARWHVLPIYVWAAGVTHFVLTITVYLQSRNLHYFASTWKNRALYFLVPAGIFLFFDLYAAFSVAATLPLFDNAFRRSIRFLDFHHVTRQSYGVTQLLKGSIRQPFPAWMRKAENAYFWSLTFLLLLVFWFGGKFDVNERELCVLAAVVAGLFLVVLFGFWQTWRKSTRRRELFVPLVYVVLQSLSAWLGVFRTELWAFGLAMHYVEYHVLMVPRCFDTPLDSTSATDRAFARLRRSKSVFYLALFAVAGGITWLTWSAMGPMIVREQQSGGGAYVALIALFDGIFVVHYFVESLIWRFRVPFYRESLKPLYFGGKA